jgi:hypothetical protein
MKVGDIVTFKEDGETLFAKVKLIKRQRTGSSGKMETRFDLILPDGFEWVRFNPAWKIRKATLEDLLFETLGKLNALRCK